MPQLERLWLQPVRGGGGGERVALLARADCDRAALTVDAVDCAGVVYRGYESLDEQKRDDCFAALLDAADDYQLQVGRTDPDVVTLSWHRCIADGLAVKLGAVPMRKNADAAPSLMDVLGMVADSASAGGEQCKRKDKLIEDLREQRDTALKDLGLAVDKAETMEAALFGKFAAALNAKKEHFRSLRHDESGQASTSASSGGGALTAGSPEPLSSPDASKNTRADSSAGSTPPKRPEIDLTHDDDDEEPPIVLPAKRGRHRAGARIRKAADAAGVAPGAPGTSAACFAAPPVRRSPRSSQQHSAALLDKLS